VQLIEVVREGSRWQYRVSQDGARVLESHGGRRIAVASVCGLYRTGKSYLLNLLLGRVQQGLPLFQVGSTTNACTEGLWLWGAADEDDLEAPLLAFVDCEGFGSTDSDRSRDAQLMTLCALISSVLVLNTKGALNEGVFNSLALTCRFAEHIEERGNEVSRPALMWVLRDFMLDLTSPDGRSISPDAYLEQALTSCSAAEVDDDRAQGAKEVKDSLLRFFDSRTCSVLVRPAHEESQLQQLERVPYRGLREEFRSGVEALRARIEAACAAGPKSVGGQALGCGAFVALLGKLVASMNSNQMLDIRGSWENVQHEACGALAAELAAGAAQKLRGMTAGGPVPGGRQLPLPEGALREVLEELWQELRAEWTDRALGDEEIQDAHWRDLQQAVEDQELLVLQQNARLLEGRQAVERSALAEQAAQGELRSKGHELEDLRAQLSAAHLRVEEGRAREAGLVQKLEAAVADLDAARRRETELGEQLRKHQNHEACLRGELDAMRKGLESLKGALAASGEEKGQLELQLDGVRGEARRRQEVLTGEAERLRKQDVEQVRLMDEARGRADAERRNLARALEEESCKRMEDARRLGELEVQVETSELQCRQLRRRMEERDAQAHESEQELYRLRAEAEQLRGAVQKAEQDTEARLRQQMLNFERRLSLEAQRAQRLEKQPGCCALRWGRG